MKKELTPVPEKAELRWACCWLAFQWLLLPSLLVLLLGDLLSLTRLNALVFAVNFAVTLPLFRRFLGRSLDSFLRSPGPCLFAALQGFGLYWLGNLLLSLVILQIDPQFSNINDASIGAMVSEDFALMALCTVLLVPITEELLYRGIFFGGLYNRSRPGAFLLSTAVFALVHVAAYAGSVPPLTMFLCFLQYLPAGIALAWAWMRSGNILSPILMHMAINAIGILAMR